MSYDLFFDLKGTASRSEVQAYFRSNPHYEVDENTGSIIYSNDDTGVYFIFDQDNSDRSDLETENETWSFNLNFYCPRYFALEAWIELERFIQRFDPSILDPQTDDEAPFTRDLFISEWNRGNRFACKAISSERDESPSTLPTADLLRIWNWNLAREDYQARMSQDVFVPKIMFGRADGATCSAAVWPDGIPSVLPPVDVLIILREQLAPWRLLGRKKETFFVPWPSIAPVLEAAASSRTADALVLNYAKVPDEIERFVKQLKPSGTIFEGLRADQVLDAELLKGQETSAFPD